MKIRLINAYAALAVAGALLAGTAGGQEKSATDSKGDKAKESEGANAEGMKRWQEAMTPGPSHKALESLAGEWNIEAKFWMAGPDGEPMVSKGTAKAHWILGGRFLQEDVSSEMMNMPFQGMGITGYDNMKKKYVSSWVDNMGTAISTSEGTADADGKVFTFTGKMDDVMTGQKDKMFKYITRVVSPDKHIFEMHDMSLGAKTKTGEITYTRKS